MRKNLYPILLFATIFLAVGCMGGGGSTTGTGTGTATATGTGGNVDQVALTNQMTFSPVQISAHAGDTVKFSNNGNLTHTVTSDTGQAGLDSSTQFPNGIGPGSSFSWPVTANATIGTHYFLHCAFHGSAGNGQSLGFGMAAEITVN